MTKKEILDQAREIAQKVHELSGGGKAKVWVCSSIKPPFPRKEYGTASCSKCKCKIYYDQRMAFNCEDNAEKICLLCASKMQDQGTEIQKHIINNNFN